MKIYIAGSISGQSGAAVMTYFDETKKTLKDLGFDVMSPMTAKGFFRNEIAFKAHGYLNPVSTNHAIIERDHWMVQQCDILYCNLTMSNDRVSIGSTMELAWAHHLGKHTVVAMQDNNIHQHAFVLEAADVIFETHELALEYLANFGSPQIGISFVHGWDSKLGITFPNIEDELGGVGLAP